MADPRGRHVPAEESRSEAAVASAARTASGESSAFDTHADRALEATLTITATTGTDETLDVALHTSIDDGATYDVVGSFPQKTAAGTDGNVFGPLGDKCKWVWTIGGTDTPGFTFSIAAEAQRDN
jgi:hypothetical protein